MSTVALQKTHTTEGGAVMADAIHRIVTAKVSLRGAPQFNVSVGVFRDLATAATPDAREGDEYTQAVDLTDPVVAVAFVTLQDAILNQLAANRAEMVDAVKLDTLTPAP